MTDIKSVRGLKRSFEARSTEIREYFEHLPSLLDAFPLDIALAYIFSRAELAENMALYCGLVKTYRADAALARHAVDTHEKTRAGFEAMYENVFGHALPKRALEAHASAQEVRNRVLHGKRTYEKEKRQAIADILDYAQSVNSHVDGLAGFMPFDDLRGFKGRAKSLNRQTTRWILKGIGLSLA